MKFWRLLSVAMVIAVLASIIGVGAAQGAVATNQAPPAPKVTVLALPFALADTPFPVLVLAKNAASSTIDDPEFCIDAPGCTLDLPEDACVDPWFGIPAKGYGFAIWFVSAPDQGKDYTLIIGVTLTGTIGGAVVTGSDSVEIDVYMG